MLAWQLRSQHAWLLVDAASSRVHSGAYSCSTMSVTATFEAGDTVASVSHSAHSVQRPSDAPVGVAGA